eukprot:TRINITY_DN44053_c0_g1_i1.p1 TRINITY_DN44053_c0_g1~~TRINITY_DN44053_c0_g1_i1.p1  ORF type:complete len:231 (+),score=28.48 TRINITY_DN44053_c0_g1_i1:53-745(+)
MAIVSDFGSKLLCWSHEPSSWKRADDGSELEIVPDTGKDYWARTYYSPLLIKSNAPALLCEIPAKQEATLELEFTLHPVEQFDQAGALVLIDENTWVKAGIEYCDGAPRLSCVVTNGGFSDWSTQMLESVHLRLRVHKLLPGEDQGPAMVLEFAQGGKHEESGPALKKAKTGTWTFVRIASVRSGEKAWRMGPFAASPIEQKGGKAVFHKLNIGPRLDMAHQTDPGHKDM